MKVQFCLLLVICLFTAKLTAQTQRFDAGIVLGFNLSELEGNDLSSYIGLNTGLIATTRLAKRWRLGLEMLYSQNGEYSLPEYYPPVDYGKIRLDFLEIPIHLNYLAKNNKSKFYNWRLALGPAYTRLLSYKAKTKEGQDVSDDIIWKDKDAILLQAGVSYFFSPHFGLNIKSSFSTDSNVLGWTMALRGVYFI